MLGFFGGGGGGVDLNYKGVAENNEMRACEGCMDAHHHLFPPPISPDHVRLI